MVEAIQFIKNDQKFVCSRIFVFTLNVSDKFSISKEYLNPADIFSKHNARKLLPNHHIELEIDMELKITLFFRFYLYSFKASIQRVSVISKRKLAFKLIKPSKSQEKTVIFFVKNINRSFRLFVNYRSLKCISIKTKYSLYLFFEIFDQLKKVKYYTRINVFKICNLVRIFVGNE